MLPFSKNSVDRIIALESAQHFKPFKDFISEASRILKKDGIFTFAIPVTGKKSNIKNLGMLSFTWSSEHYDKGFIIDATSKKFSVVEKMEVGSHVFEPLTDYYVKNRKPLQDIILKQYPSYVENILFKSLLKMKKASQEKLIDYLLVKCIKIK
jgi:cyclopropane fatty-acyl-phospholipid synthase-like methyltransferase